MKTLPQEILVQLPKDKEVVIATTNNLYTRVFMEDGEVFEFKDPSDVVRLDNYTFPLVGKGNIKTLGYPVGLRAWGHALSKKVTGSDYKLLDLKENNAGKTRVKFTLEKDTVIAHRWTSPVIIKKGVYDYIIPTPRPQDWSGWFND